MLGRRSGPLAACAFGLVFERGSPIFSGGDMITHTGVIFGTGSDVMSAPSSRALHLLAATLRILCREQQLSEHDMRTDERSFGIWGCHVRGVRFTSHRPRTMSSGPGLLYLSCARTSSAHHMRGAADPVTMGESSRGCFEYIGRVRASTRGASRALHIIVQPPVWCRTILGLSKLAGIRKCMCSVRALHIL